MLRAKQLLFITVLACLLSGCTGTSAPDTVAVPRRHAYPRIELPDSAFTEVSAGAGNLTIGISKASTIALRGSGKGNSGFIDVAYPGFNSSIYFTVTPVTPATAGEVIDNRVERMELNLGGAEAELLEFDTPAGFECKVLVSRGEISTPVQFIATDGASLVVSGAAFVRDASPSAADSIAPVVGMLRRDIIHALSTMHR